MAAGFHGLSSPQGAYRLRIGTTTKKVQLESLRKFESMGDYNLESLNQFTISVAAMDDLWVLAGRNATKLHRVSRTAGIGQATAQRSKPQRQKLPSLEAGSTDGCFFSTKDVVKIPSTAWGLWMWVKQKSW